MIGNVSATGGAIWATEVRAGFTACIGEVGAWAAANAWADWIVVTGNVWNAGYAAGVVTVWIAGNTVCIVGSTILGSGTIGERGERVLDGRGVSTAAAGEAINSVGTVAGATVTNVIAGSDLGWHTSDVSQYWDIQPNRAAASRSSAVNCTQGLLQEYGGSLTLSHRSWSQPKTSAALTSSGNRWAQNEVHLVGTLLIDLTGGEAMLSAS
jgi:hypothetical protein